MKKYKLKKKPFIMIVFCVSVLFLFTFNVTSSRYMGQTEGDALDVVAIPILTLEEPTFVLQGEEMLPGDIRESDFYVSNYDEQNTNEVLMNYYLKIRVQSVIPVTITLTDEDGNEVVLTEDRTSEFELPYDKQMKTKYHIKIEWNEKDDSYEYAGQDIQLVIDLIATQVVEG